MEQLEKVEKIRSKMQVTYEEAKNALTACNWDVLDAIVYLEKLGKVKAPDMSMYTTRAEESAAFKQAEKEYEKKTGRYTVGELFRKFFNWCAGILKLSCDSFFEVTRDGRNILCMPVLILVLLLLCSFGTTLLVLIIGLFFNFHYTFTGPIAQADVNINDVCSKAATVCETIKKDFSEKKENQE